MMWIVTVAVVMLLNVGQLVYGQADPICPPGSYGPDCVCTEDTSNETCINPASPSGKVCSGRGDCICGTCECHPRRAHTAEKYSGEFCQCDDYSCSYYDYMLCGGNGRCECFNCVCDEGFSGDACECPSSNSTCLASNGQLCNGVGDCVCGRCQCNKDTYYKGPTCEECPTCPGLCIENNQCALCVAFQSGEYTKEECESKCRHVTVIDQLDVEDIKDDDRRNLCQFADEDDDCQIWFSYIYTREGYNVYVESTKFCPETKILPGNHATREVFSLIGLVLSACAVCVFMFV